MRSSSGEPRFRRQLAALDAQPGHLTSFDEWVHSPVRPGSREKIASGMVFQSDIIPTPLPAGRALNCEDTVAFADAALRAEMRAAYPELWGGAAAQAVYPGGAGRSPARRAAPAERWRAVPAAFSG